MERPNYFTAVESPLGELTLVATDSALCGLYFDAHRPTPRCEGWIHQDGPHFDATRRWLRAYFSGETLPAPPAWEFPGGTDFQRRVWTALQAISRSETRTYAQIAHAVGAEKAVRAVGAAVGRNPLSILIPCHRVIGSSGALTGYAGGVDRKQWLLEHEGGLLS